MAARAGGRLTFEAMKQLVAHRVKGQSYESFFDQLKVVSGGDGCCTCEITVSPNMLNPAGTLHGGVIASLVDTVSTYALTTTGSGRPGSSVNLSVSYIRPVKLNEVITVSAETLSCGRTIAFANVAIFNKSTGKLVAQGSHSKFVGDTKTTDS